MLCPACKDNDNSVIDSRLSEGGLAVRRRRLCRNCGRRFTTKERVEEELRVTVLKAGGQRVPYSRDNIVRGLERACYKLNVTDAQLSELVDRVEEEIFTHHDREVKTEQIGKYIGEHLRKLNAVAYVRFMSVHRKFETVDEFIDAISEVRARAAVEIPDQRSLFEG